MKLKFEAPKRQRIKSQFIGFEADCYLMWNNELKTWVNDINNGNYTYTSIRECKSVKAFKRMLKTSPKGVKFKLNSIYVGHNVYGIGTGEELK